jgi:outer membrane receptor protein involved in Fe transport
MGTVKSLLSLRVVTLLLALALPAELFAGNTGKISGTVRDSRTKEPIPGVNIVVDGTKLGASSSVDGNYVILNVPPGVYTVSATYIGYKRFVARDIRISVDFTTPLEVLMEEGSVELEGIVVQGERTPLIRQDLTNPVASISSEAIQALPVTDISEVIALQAGITVGDDGVLHIRGGYGNEVLYSVNGVNVNNPYGNTRSIGIATNAVQEVSVSGGTFNAEYGNALSGVVNYVTKDGSATWTGSFRYFTGDYQTKRNDIYFGLDEFKPTNVYRLEGSLGGPIIGETLTFFASGVYSYNGGYIFGQQIYRPEDAHLARNLFPSTDPRAGSASDPYYFGPTLHPTTDMEGLPTGNGDIVAMNWSRSYNIQGNLSLRIAPEMKLKYEFIYNFTENPDGSGNSWYFSNQFKPDGRALDRGEGYLHSVEFTHTVSDRMFYTLRGSYTIDKNSTWAYEDPGDPRYVPSYYLTAFPNTSYLTGGVDPFRFHQRTDTYAGKFDLVAQVWKEHEIKAGVEVRSHKLVVDSSYTLLFRDPNDPSATPNFTNELAGNTFLPYIPDSVSGLTYYERHPLQIAAYLQDKIELFRSIILNLGLRYEFFRSDAMYNPELSKEVTEGQSIFLQQNLTKAPDKHMLAPRFSVSYPITDQGSIRFSYGHFYQIGSLASLYRNPYFRALPGTTPSFGNANVNPQKSIQYEMGLQQGLTQDMRVEITGYYKDVSDYIYNQQIITGNGDLRYNVLTNLSYANTRGISVSLLKRRSPEGMFSATLDYTFQIVEGQRTEPSEEIFYNEQRGQLSETYLVPLTFDRSHTITSTMTLTQPSNWIISIIGWFRTGTPYTPAFPANVVPITFTQNSDNQPVQWNVDLKAEKFFKVGDVDLSVFLQVDNLFDTENEIAVYASTGRALYDITSTLQPELLADLRNRIARGDPGMIPMRAVDNYYARAGNLNAPRLIRFGTSVIF